MVVITGGAGMIGSAIIYELNRRGRDDILVVDHLGTGEKWKNLRALRFRDYLEKEVFLRQVSTGEVFGGQRIESILHLGACSATTERDATYLVENNFAYSKQLACFAAKNGIRFIYASSAATYGDGCRGFLDDETALETLRPLNMYGYSKHLFDLWIRDNGLMENMVGLKYFNVFGPNEHHKGNMRSVVLKAYEQILTTGTLRLFKSNRNDYADGEQLRDFIYVKDAAAMTLHFLDKPHIGGIFNIGGGEANSWNRLAAAVFNALNRSIAIEYIDMPTEIGDTYQYYTRADITKLRRSGYDRAITVLESSVADYVTNYLLPGKHLGDQ
ncbi:ADP-glyceromanno-heptose 6-epimerase [Trichloromonas sp.]|uniref:ADP-glyceromanno-heptose 6-epimerase n=1 Tax=Trichloromonas sp. TaxID=3069249 RepID=UPI002A3E6A63|nr:ADP-glyceromanno-heptose 6-epimerase [Trichloromonas sp.]